MLHGRTWLAGFCLQPLPSRRPAGVCSADTNTRTELILPRGARIRPAQAPFMFVPFLLARLSTCICTILEIKILVLLNTEKMVFMLAFINS